MHKEDLKEKISKFFDLFFYSTLILVLTVTSLTLLGYVTHLHPDLAKIHIFELSVVAFFLLYFKYAYHSMPASKISYFRIGLSLGYLSQCVITSIFFPTFSILIYNIK